MLKLEHFNDIWPSIFCLQYSERHNMEEVHNAKEIPPAFFLSMDQCEKYISLNFLSLTLRWTF